MLFNLVTFTYHEIVHVKVTQVCNTGSETWDVLINIYIFFLPSHLFTLDTLPL